MIFALAGNQNCGKTTLFNQLTGSNQHVGNFPGVTIEGKDGLLRGYRNISIVDLPGIYSLSPYTQEEIVTRDFLLKNKINCIINIVDATNIERNLYLTLQLIELNIPMVIALNMMDEIRANGVSIDVPKLSESIGIPIIPIAANKNEGVDELIETAVNLAKNKIKPKRMDFCRGAIHRAIHSLAILVEDHAEKLGIEPRFAATKLIEGDEPIIDSLMLSENEIDVINHTVSEMEQELNTDREAALADMRYSFIDKICSFSVVKPGDSKQHIRSIKIDNILTHKYLAIPIFLLIMILIFWLTFGVFGKALSSLLSMGIDYVTNLVDNALYNYGINPIVHSLVINGIFLGVGTVLSFLPVITVLFFFLSLLEDTGYMARVAFVMDKSLRKIGLSGRSFVPILIGFGCTVPAIMSTRTLSSERDRKFTIFLTPFMSCSAKLPIYSMFTMVFFSEHQTLVMILLYIIGIIFGVISGAILNKTVFKVGNPSPFIMELPNYRLPSDKSVLLMLWDKIKDYLQKAFTVIFISTIVIWFLQNFDSKINLVTDSSNSMLAGIGKFISPIFYPLGFSDWRASTALLAGFTAKEAVVSTFAVLTSNVSINLSSAMHQIFTPISAFSFLLFTLLYTPCIVAITTVKKELKSLKTALCMVLLQTSTAWVVAFIFYNFASLFSH